MKKNLIGLSMVMSVTDNRTVQLWQKFMHRRNEITEKQGEEFYSLQEYDKDYFKSFDPQREFTKWAAVEVSDKVLTPEGFDKFELTDGLYAVFHYKGLPGNPEIFRYIYQQWLPGSEYALDHRPHFELLGNRYKNNDPDSEEEIYIPVVKKGN